MEARSGIVTLTTDFGEGHYVAAMKGAILSQAPHATLVDVCHSIEPQNVLEAAICLWGAAAHFPPGTVHCAVVDPGVGTSRRIVLAEADGEIFLAPDNGLLTLLLDAAEAPRAWSVENSAYFRRPVSPTFHGRDIFAPVAGAVAAGERLSSFGPAIATESLVRLAPPEPLRTSDAIEGEVMFVDRFGNLITNIHAAELASLANGGELEISCAGASLRGVKSTYGEAAAGEAIALVGSLGYLEVAVAGGSAAERLKASVGAAVCAKRAAKSA